MRSTSRRAFLGGAGAIVALPLLEALAPRRARAAAAGGASRLVVYYFPCGRDPSGWVSRTTGSQFSLPSSLASLAPLQQDGLFLTGLNDVPAQNSTSVGDHAKGTGTLLTGVPIVNGQVFDAGTSLDQLIATRLAGSSRFSSLQWTSAQPTVCDLGASCTYTQCISWADARTPLAPISDPLTAYNQLFAGSDPGASQSVLAQTQKNQKSVLDYVLAEGNSMLATLTASDRSKMDEYFTSIRALENSLFVPASSNCQPGSSPAAGPDYASSVAAFGSMMVMALQCNLAPVITYMIEFDISYRAHPWVQATLGHHALTHTGGADAQQQLLRVEKWQAEQMAAFVTQLKAATDANGASLLDSTLVLATPSLGLGASHDHGNLSPILFGRAGGQFSTGRALAYGNRQPFNNLLVSIGQAMGLGAGSFGADGSAPLPNLGGA